MTTCLRLIYFLFCTYRTHTYTRFVFLGKMIPRQSWTKRVENIKNEKLQKAYTGLPVVRVTQRTAALQLIFSSGVSLRPFEGSPTCRASRGPLAHTFNYFVMSCPILRSFSLLSFRNKFSLKITKHALE